jgi:hypothetical protein
MSAFQFRFLRFLIHRHKQQSFSVDKVMNKVWPGQRVWIAALFFFCCGLKSFFPLLLFLLRWFFSWFVVLQPWPVCIPCWVVLLLLVP